MITALIVWLRSEHNPPPHAIIYADCAPIDVIEVTKPYLDCLDHGIPFSEALGEITYEQLQAALASAHPMEIDAALRRESR